MKIQDPFIGDEIRHGSRPPKAVRMSSENDMQIYNEGSSATCSLQSNKNADSMPRDEERDEIEPRVSRIQLWLSGNILKLKKNTITKPNFSLCLGTSISLKLLNVPNMMNIYIRTSILTYMPKANLP